MAATLVSTGSMETSLKKNEVSMSMIDQKVIEMGIPDMVVAMARAYQRYEHGTDINDVDQLYTLADEIYSNPQKQLRIARKMADEANKTSVEKKKQSKKKKSPTAKLKTDNKTCHVPAGKVQEEKVVGVEATADVSAAMQVKNATAVADTTATASCELVTRQQLQEKVQKLARENHKLRQRKTCRKCRKVDLAVSGVTFLPCGHFITCEECSEVCEDCPACGKAIMGTVRTFLS